MSGKGQKKYRKKSDRLEGKRGIKDGRTKRKVINRGQRGQN